MSNHWISKHNPSSGKLEDESLYLFCSRLSKKNNGVLFKLEEYLNKPLLSDPALAEIRDTILTVSAEITKINDQLKCGDENKGLL
ncbi:hypothetical protein SAMN05421503_1430 [Terribacillus aidingensis]|uniref:Uncharacterized protein n=1 Tax=Terribacillus aidingensis TaxID=586416 RepID=A0A285NLZ3_9BACI|nr:hypothetical protein [Terribacillus aidingensis]SNZ09943.1 hypothetical protein SAMN05421503_1430 [Terribacillus aidingensis]